MNKIWRRILSSICLLLVMLSLTATPVLADPGNPPIWPPVQNGPVLTSTVDANATLTPTATQTVSQ